MEALFSRTRAIRRSIIDAGQETSAPDFGRPHAAEPVAIDVNVEPPAPLREHGGGDDA
jgi:cyclohexadieny/prephenate dehydrogenase